MSKKNTKVKEYTKELNKLAKESGPVKTIPWPELDPNWYQNMMKKQEEAENKAREEEKKRIEDMKCPVCKSTEKGFVSHGKDNGIFGPGYHYSETDSYWVCHKCGVMFKDLNKPQRTGRMR
jgi:transposase-like protein